MGVLDDIADKLAVDALAAAEEFGDEGLVDELAKVLEASSTFAFESYMSSIRARVALTRARTRLTAKIAAAQKAKDAPPT